ncbi:neutral zinc metallopeptidase [Candidatus Saccharibacteria bacterium]|nr:neutral zinc metallopeptidase [Candidatus Saccharibacteria bacterium]
MRSALRKVRLPAALLLLVAVLTTGCGSAGSTGSAASPAASSVAGQTPIPGLATASDGQAPARTTGAAGASGELGGLATMRLPQAQSNEAFQSEVLSTGTPSAAEATAYITAVVEDADQTWSQIFADSGLAEPTVSYAIIQPGSTGISSECTGGQPIPSDFNNAFYCWGDADPGTGYVGALYFPVETFMQMWNGQIFGRDSLQAGDFGAAVVIGHEFGHHIQAELQEQLQLVPIAAANGAKLKEGELIADCFAGVWAYSAYSRSRLDETDVQEGIEAIAAIGDLEEGGDDPHGTAAERVDAFYAGYREGRPATCVQLYWPGVTVN